MTQLRLLETRHPVLSLLEEQRERDLARLRQGLEVIADWGAFDLPRRTKTEAALHALLDSVLMASENLRQLPKTTACICPGCSRVTLPSAGGSYACCGRIWFAAGRAGHQALPDDFWDTHKPGDPYTGKTQAAWAQDETA